MDQLITVLIDNIPAIVAGLIGLFLPNPKVRKILGKIADGINKGNSKSDK